MKVQRLSPRMIASVLALALGVAWAWAQTAAGNASLSSVGKMLPKGFVSRQVTVPTFDLKGRKTSQLQADTLVRIDEARLKVGNAVIEVFAEDRKQDLRLQMPSAYYHLQDKILRSDERCKVSRMDMQTEGDSLVFDTETSIGSMVGKVRTLIFQTAKDVTDSPDRALNK